MSDPRRRDVLETAGMVVAVGGLAGCADTGQQTDDQEGETPADEPEETQQAGNGEQGALRVAHVSPDAPNVDIYVDGEPVIEDLSFGEVSPYAALDPGTYEVAVTAAEDEDTVVFDEEIDLDAGVARTAVAFGEAAGGPDTGFQIELLDDDLTDPGEEMSRLRLFHAVPDAGAVDVVVVEGPEGGDDDQPSDARLFEAVEFGETVSATVPAGDYTLGVAPAGDRGGPNNGMNPTHEGNDTQGRNMTGGGTDAQGGDETGEPNTSGRGPQGQQAQGPAAEFDLGADSQTAYTAFAIGYLDPQAVGSEAGFEVVAVTDASEGERADGGTASGALFHPTA